jgi:hypothetical protein
LSKNSQITELDDLLGGIRQLADELEIVDAGNSIPFDRHRRPWIGIGDEMVQVTGVPPALGPMVG